MLGYYIQTSVTGLVILSILLVNINKIKGERKFNDRIFTALVVSNASLLILEALLNFLNHNESTQSHVLLLAVVFLFYLCNPLPPALWALFVHSWILRGKAFTPGIVLAACIPFAFNTLLVISSLQTGYSFYLDETGLYHRGQGYLILVLADLFYLVGASLLVAWYRDQIRRREVFALIFFPVPPLLAGLLQTMFFGISVLWLAMSISLLIIYLDLQSTNVHVDHLTGLANRRKLDQFLNYLSTKRRTTGQYGGISIDVDRFKAINDDYGHELGDRILEGVGKILRRSLGSRDLISRYGGDEFIIILEVGSEEELQAATDQRMYQNKQCNQCRA